MNRASLAGLVIAFAVLTGCDDDAVVVGPTADLPPGWEGAQEVSEFVQKECSGSPYEGKNERVSFSPGAGRVAIAYLDAHFRCEQEVEGFFKASGSTVDVLVQPIDMSPDSVVKCDCLYAIDIVLEPVARGENTITVYRRWDHMNNDTTPFEIGSETVLVE